MSKDSIKVTLLTNIPTPYRIPVFNRLSQEGGLALKVLFMSPTEANRDWEFSDDQFDFDFQFLRGWHAYLGKWEIPIHFNWAVWNELVRSDPDVIITTGYENPAYWQALLYRKAFRKKYILWSGTTCSSARHVRGPIATFKRAVVGSADAFYAYGTQAAGYLEYLGASPDDIHIGVNTVNMNEFRSQALHAAKSEEFTEKRRKYPHFLLLYSGQLIDRKGIESLIDALHILNDSDIGLLIVGGGPLESHLRELCQRYGLNQVYFEKFQQYSSLPAYYAMADVTVMPSLAEVWGLVVNESLAAGTYVLCSDKAGSGQDLIKDCWNGGLFDPSNIEELARLIKETKENLCEIRSRRELISEHACREFGIEQSTTPMIEAIRTVCKK